MAYLQNKQYKEIYEASKNGNEKAKMIIQALRKNQSQADLDRLTEDYYSIQTNTQVELENANLNEFETEKTALEEDNQIGTTIAETSQSSPMDLTEILDGEMEGLLDELEIDDTSFGDFLEEKSRNGVRARKNSDYFKAYDINGRTEYMKNKINSYKSGFDGRLRDIERRHGDVSSAMGIYSQNVNDMLDDGVELDMNQAGLAYDDLVKDKNTMGSFGRHWDETDNNVVAEKLRTLVSQYGKQNVLAALNTISADNDSYRDYLNNQIDSEVSRYTKSIEGILK